MDKDIIQRKVAVFGLDGITFDLLQPWLDEGRLPNLARIIKQGSSGRLRTTIPPVSASAWASFFTGTNPGQHGMVDFTYPAPDGYEIRVSNSQTCGAQPIWDMVGRAGKKVGIVSMPMTYPPHPVNGFMLCSFLTPRADAEYTYPPELKSEISEIGNFPLHMSEKGRGTDPTQFVHAVKEMEIARAETVKYLLKNKAWDLFIYVIETTDNLQHEVWHLLDKSHPRHDPVLAQKILPEILDYYQTVDAKLGEFLDTLPEETLLILMSDHGFGPFHKFFHINNWLVQQGLLKFKRTPIGLLKRLTFTMGATPINALKWVTRLRLGKMRKNVKRGRGRKMLRRLFLSFDDVDWSRTKAFSVGNFGQVYLNVQGQRPQGIVPPEEYDALCTSLSEQALGLRDPQDGNQVVQKVYRRDELFHGSRSKRMPDLILHTNRARYVSFGHADFGSNQVIEPSTGQTGHHHMLGVIAMTGPGIRQNHTLENTSILDLVPTILHYLNLPVPSNLDGKVLLDAFSEEFKQHNQVQVGQVGSGTMSEEDDTFSSEDNDLVMKRLKDLGYVA